MALPADLQEIEPGFVHYPKQNLPVIEAQGHKTTVIIGSYRGKTSPVSVHLETLYLDQHLDQGFDTRLADDVHQRAVYLVSGILDIDGCVLTPGNMAVIRPGIQATLLAKSDCHFMEIGGEDVGERHLWWNFVHTSKDRIEQAKKDWRDGGFERITDDDEFIPLPE
jgi:redox-sensitive bicupin YhaK (pirin superfamily)